MRIPVLLALLTATSLQLQAQPAFTCNVTAGIPPFVRAEGITEPTGDLVLNCTGGTADRCGSSSPTLEHYRLSQHQRNQPAAGREQQQQRGAVAYRRAGCER
jgi:hypothetical protein